MVEKQAAINLLKEQTYLLTTFRNETGKTVREEIVYVFE